jgi:hypothetical protein
MWRRKENSTSPTTDVTISLWFLATLANDLHEIVLSKDSTTYTTCNTVLGFFTAKAPTKPGIACSTT